MTLKDIFGPARALSVQMGPAFRPLGQTFEAHGERRPVGVMIHRVLPTEGEGTRDDSPEGVCDYFSSGKASVTQPMPFALYVGREGGPRACLPLGLKAPQAWRGDGTHIAIGVVGNFRSEHGGAPPSAEQLENLVGVIAHLGQSGVFDPSHELSLVARDLMPEWASLKDVESPGDLLPVDELKEIVLEQMAYSVSGISLELGVGTLMRSDHIMPRMQTAEAELRDGDLLEALHGFYEVAPLVHPLLKAQVLVNMARVRQFLGSSDLRRNACGTEHFFAAQLLLTDADRSVGWRPWEADSRSSTAQLRKNEIALQRLQVRRAQSHEKVDADLLADFISLRSALTATGGMPGAVAFTYFLEGDLERAAQGYRAISQTGDDLPDGLGMCRLGQVLLAQGKCDEATVCLDEGLQILRYFPERDDFERNLQEARQRWSGFRAAS